MKKCTIFILFTFINLVYSIVLADDLKLRYWGKEHLIPYHIEIDGKYLKLYEICRKSLQDRDDVAEEEKKLLNYSVLFARYKKDFVCVFEPSVYEEVRRVNGKIVRMKTGLTGPKLIYFLDIEKEKIIRVLHGYR